MLFADNEKANRGNVIDFFSHVPHVLCTECKVGQWVAMAIKYDYDEKEAILKLP